MQRFVKFLFRNSFLIFVLHFNAELFSQNLYTVEGKVTDAKTGEPLAYVNVFLSQTTIGATTGANGVYRIGKIPSGKFNIVASIVGYESKIASLDMRTGEKRVVDFKLERSLYQFNQIEVKDEIPKEWFDQLEFFKKLFFGQNQYAEDCEIKNPYQIDFKEENNTFSAVAHEPIIVLNKALGYKVECVLKSFSFDKTASTLRYQVHPSFSEMKTLSKDSSDIFTSNRDEVYRSSLGQLLVSLTVNNYKFIDDGFQLSTSSGIVRRAKDIVEADTVHAKFFLKVKGCMRVKYWNDGKKTFSSICLKTGIAEFDPSGYFIDPDEFTLEGYMANEGMATMLPRFWKKPE